MWGWSRSHVPSVGWTSSQEDNDVLFWTIWKQKERCTTTELNQPVCNNTTNKHFYHRVLSHWIPRLWIHIFSCTLDLSAASMSFTSILHFVHFYIYAVYLYSCILFYYFIVKICRLYFFIDFSASLSTVRYFSSTLPLRLTLEVASELACISTAVWDLCDATVVGRQTPEWFHCVSLPAISTDTMQTALSCQVKGTRASRGWWMWPLRPTAAWDVSGFLQEKAAPSTLGLSSWDDTGHSSL